MTHFAPAPDGFLRDPHARTESYYALTPHVHVTPALVEDLRARAEASHRNIRLCLHTSPEDTLHEMLIFQWADQFFPPKKHPHKTKSFRVLSGTLALMRFSPEGTLLSGHQLTSATSLHHRVGPDTFHADLPLTDFAIHLEITTGPFQRETDRVLAPWAPSPGDHALTAWRELTLKKLPLT